MTEIPVEGSVLRWARLYRGLSEKDAAKRLGVTITELSEYENNDRKPTLGMFEAFAAQYQLQYRTIGGASPVHSFDFNVALGNIRTLLAQLAETYKCPQR